jgi:hypothetical protein
MTNDLRLKCTYTKDAHKKIKHNRKWLDGSLIQAPMANVLVLTSEEGVNVATVRLPEGFQLLGHGDNELDLFAAQGILVVVEAAADATDDGQHGAAEAALSCKPTPALQLKATQAPFRKSFTLPRAAVRPVPVTRPATSLHPCSARPGHAVSLEPPQEQPRLASAMPLHKQQPQPIRTGALADLSL